TVQSRAPSCRRQSRLPAMAPESAEANQLLLPLIPEAEGKSSHARPQCDRLDPLEQRVLPVALLEVVVRDGGAQMMDVVKADVRGEPLQHSRQFVVRAAAQGRLREVPFRSPLP